MFKLTALAVLVALLGVNVQAWYYPDYTGVCKEYGRSDFSCEASASLHIKVYGRGQCTGSAKGYCSTYAKRTNDCIDHKNIYIDGECRDVSIYEDAKCWAAAVSSAITAAASSVNCRGKKAYGCGEGKAKAKAIACSVAKVIIDLNVQLNYKKAECDAKIKTAISAIAEATAESHAKSCSKFGVPGVDKDVDLAFAIEKVAAEAFGSCWVYCDGKGIVKSVVDGGATTTVKKSEKLALGDDAHAFVGGGH